MSEPLTAQPHRDAMKYLRVQAGVFFFSGFAALFVIALAFFFSAHALKGLDFAWMIPGLVLAVGSMIAGRWSLRHRAPPLTLAGQQLSVGGTTVALDARTTIELAKPGPLPLPRPTKIAMFRLPGFTGFPHFDGGPRVRVRNGEQAVELQPLLYGPAAFFGDAADPQTTALVQQLVDASTRGEVSPWLRSIFLPAETPKVITSVTSFVVSYTIISAGIVGFLGYLLVRSLSHR